MEPDATLNATSPARPIPKITRHLDPRSYLVFRRVFGEAPLLRAFLNALLPLAEDERIVSLEYLTSELVPEIPLFKYTIMNVRCKDARGRQFIVEMQMDWTSAFLRRVLFNASKAYVSQLERGRNYRLLQPVYGLSLLDDTFHSDPARFYHNYQMASKEQPDDVIRGLQLVFVELPKFKASVGGGHGARDLWLRFLCEVGRDENAAGELAGSSAEMARAVELTEVAAYTPEELAKYDRSWDAVSTEKTLMEGKFAEGLEEGQRMGQRQGLDLALANLMSNGISEPEARRLLGMN